MLEQVGPLATPVVPVAVASAGATDGATGLPVARLTHLVAEAVLAVRDVGAPWEGACFAAGCRVACALAAEALGALEARLHAARPVGYTVEGWRARWLVTRMGEVRVRRRLYRAPDGSAHFLLDEHLGWLPRTVATPDLAALLGAWATRVPYRVAVHQLGQATGGVLGASTLWRLVQAVAARATAHERATHAAWIKTGMLPGPPGERVVAVLYGEADGVWVKTQREPAHRDGYELKTASFYEGWQWLAGPTPGHPRDHYRLVAKQVYVHGFERADAKAPPPSVPFWEAVSLALAATYALAHLPVVVIGGDGANWLDTALEWFPQAVRQRDGFHLARDAARGWGTAAGATLYQAVRHGDQTTTSECLALPPPATARAVAGAVVPQLPAPVATRPATPDVPDVTPATPSPDSWLALPTAGTAGRTWSVAQVRRARADLTSQLTAPDGGVDWRSQVPPDLVPADARALGTQEGTNAHLLAKRMKHKGMAWTCPGARALAKVSELVANGRLAPWCQRASPPATVAPRAPGGFAPAGPLPWPLHTCPAAHGPLRDPTAAILHRLDTGARGHYRLN